MESASPESGRPGPARVPGLNRAELAAVFQHAGVAVAYQHRPPYPDEVFEVLDSLMAGQPSRRVLDLGAGEGALARPLAARVDRVDAVEISPAMVEQGRRRPGGDRASLNWITGSAEEARLDGPYALATAGASLHWMDWPVTLGRVARALAPGAVLAVAGYSAEGMPGQDELEQVIRRYSRSADYDPSFDLLAELQRRGLLTLLGHHETPPSGFRQSVPDFLEYLHSTSSLARELMSPGEAAAFGREAAAVLAPHTGADGLLAVPVVATVDWGRPGPG